MEILLSICLLIVPVISIFALGLAIGCMRRVQALRKLTIELAHKVVNQPGVQESIVDYMVQGS